MGILLSKFPFKFNVIQTLISRLHGDLCHIRFGDVCLIVPDGLIEIMQISTFSKPSFKTRKRFLELMFSQSFLHLLYLLLSYTLSRPEHYFIWSCPRKEYNVCYSLDRVIFAIFQMTISSGVYEYAADKRTFVNGQFFLFIMLKYLVWPVKSERARPRCVECTLTQFAISVLRDLLLNFARVSTVHGSF